MFGCLRKIKWWSIMLREELAIFFVVFMDYYLSLRGREQLLLRDICKRFTCDIHFSFLICDGFIAWIMSEWLMSKWLMSCFHCCLLHRVNVIIIDVSIEWMIERIIIPLISLFIVCDRLWVTFLFIDKQWICLDFFILIYEVLESV